MREERVKKVVRYLDDIGADAILLSSGYNMRYISGFSGATGYVWISKNKKAVLTDSRYTVQAKQEAEGFTVLQVEQGYQKLVKTILQEEKVATLAIESKDMLCHEFEQWKRAFPQMEWVFVGDEISNLRRIKTAEELHCIAKAEEIGDIAFEKILSQIKPGVTELEIAAYLEFYMKQNGAEGLSFDTIVASGVNSAMPHAVPTRKKIENGDFVTMDFGCLYQGYCSDMTRTVVVGKANEKQKKIYQTVLEAQELALEQICAGKTGAQVDAYARNWIEKAGYGACFGHGLGHSVGLFIHEGPRLSPNDSTILRANMTETVEPGIYIENFGGVRIEDLVVVTEHGCDNLTRSEKRLIEL